VTALPLPASNAFPETSERRAELAREIRAATGLDEPVLERVVRAFYGTARHDPLIGHLFDDVQDWEAHIARITDFWSSVALMSGRYHGNPMAPHLKLPLEPRHFARWLTLFEQTARDICSEAGAALLMEKARRIAQSLQFGMEAKRGVLPVRRRPA
jgi:hemoglobin